MLAIPAGDNVMRLLPPLIIEEAHVREAMKLLSETAAEFDTAKDAKTGVAA
jgi:acetylornithine/N-succinyldiaminopimelate aminotransferase